LTATTPSAAGTIAPLKPLSGWTRARVFWRSLFIQAGYNPQGQQSLGLTYALLPALKELYPEPQAEAEAVRRHLATSFNTHPYSAAAIVGGILNHEERIARGEERPESAEHFKASLMGPLAALGDGFFWFSLRPAAGALCAALYPFLGVWSAVLFLVLYNAVHLTARARFFVLGYRAGDAIVLSLSRAQIPRWGERLRAIAALCAGGLAAYLSVTFAWRTGLPHAPLAGGCLLVAAFAFSVAETKGARWVALYGSALLAIVAGALQ
jgi:PTS system mannose-specific IID component